MVKDLLKRLSDAHGVSGREGNLFSIIRDELAGSVDGITEDPLGNIVAVKLGDEFSVMLAAHMDEVGLMVKFIDEKGFIRFITIGGWFAPTLYSQRVVLHGKFGPISGVVGGKPPHLMEEAERKSAVKIEDMFIDVGAASSDDAHELGIEIGTPVTLDRECRELGFGRMTGKAFDNRVGVAILIRTMQQMDTASTVYAVFTVQEEVGMKGARTSAYGLDPSVAIATDATSTGDFPGVGLKDAPLEIGKGPAITIADASGRGLIAHPAMVRWLREAADAEDIPVQLNVGSGGTNDASVIYLTKRGIPSTTLSIPARYIHSPVEVVDTKDIDSGIRILVKALRSRPDLPLL